MVESVDFTAEDKPAPEGHDTKMAEKYAQQADSSGASVDNTETAKEPEQNTEPEKGAEEPTKEESKPEDKEESKEPTPEDFARYSNEFIENGELSEETYKELEETYNLPRSVVDEYVEGQKARVQAVEQAGYAAAGGAEEFQQLAQWAKQNLPEGEIQKFNDEVNSGDVAKAIEAVTSLKTRYTDAVGQEPTLVEGEGKASATPGYRSRQEMTADMRDARYKKDPAFRAEVERKLRNSTVL